MGKNDYSKYKKKYKSNISPLNKAKQLSSDIFDKKSSKPYKVPKVIKDAWAEERKLVLSGEATRNWSMPEQKQLILWGFVYGYEGHHMKSSWQHRKYKNDISNIQFLKGRYERRNEHLEAHGGSFRHSTNGYYSPDSKKIVDFGKNPPHKPRIKLTHPYIKTQEYMYWAQAQAQTPSYQFMKVVRRRNIIKRLFDKDKNITKAIKRAGRIRKFKR